MVGHRDLSFVVHFYDQKAGQLNLLGAGGGLGKIFTRLRWHFWTKIQRRRFLSYYLFKTMGPPTFKFLKKFPELPAGVETANPNKYSVVKREVHHDKKGDHAPAH